MSKKKSITAASETGQAGEAIMRWCEHWSEEHGKKISVAMTVLGAELGVSANTVRSWLKGGSPSIRTAVKLRDRIGVPVESW